MMQTIAMATHAVRRTSKRGRTSCARGALIFAALVGCTGSEAASGGTSNGLPCQVAEAVAERCGSRHGATPRFGAPMRLTRREDFLAPLASDSGRWVAA